MTSALDRDHKLKADDIATYAERMRDQRHHDVLCIVLKELVRGDQPQPGAEGSIRLARVEVARAYADLAYPPPKAEP